MHQLKSTVFAIVALIALTLLSGCFGNNNPDPKEVEIPNHSFIRWSMTWPSLDSTYTDSLIAWRTIQSIIRDSIQEKTNWNVAIESDTSAGWHLQIDLTVDDSLAFMPEDTYEQRAPLYVSATGNYPYSWYSVRWTGFGKQFETSNDVAARFTVSYSAENYFEGTFSISLEDQTGSQAERASVTGDFKIKADWSGN